MFQVLTSKKFRPVMHAALFTIWSKIITQFSIFPYKFREQWKNQRIVCDDMRPAIYSILQEIIGFLVKDSVYYGIST